MLSWTPHIKSRVAKVWSKLFGGIWFCLCTTPVSYTAVWLKTLHATRNSLLWHASQTAPRSSRVRLVQRFTFWGGMINISRPLGYYPTIFRAKVLAITLVADRLSEYQESHVTEETIFFLDSRAVIQAICGFRVRSSAVHQCLEALKTWSTHTNVKCRWTMALVGTVGNECTVQLAKLAIESPS